MVFSLRTENDLGGWSRVAAVRPWVEKEVSSGQQGGCCGWRDRPVKGIIQPQ